MSIRSFLDGMDEGYNSLPESTKREAELLGILNVVLTVAGVAWWVHAHRKEKKRRRLHEEGVVRHAAEYTKQLDAIRERNEKFMEKVREDTHKILDDASKPPTPEDLAELRAKLNDPNHVWEL